MKKNALQDVLEQAIEFVRPNHEGKVASYIPELAAVDDNLINAAIRLADGSMISAGDDPDRLFTLQSVAKVVVFIGMLEEYGFEQVRQWVRVEPSGDDFASIARLDQFGPLPSNPMLNAGAISLCSHVPGNAEQQSQWLEEWMTKLFGERLFIDHKVFTSERRTGDRNRSLAYLMKSSEVITGDVNQTLEIYFSSCSYMVSIRQAAYLPMLLANGGMNEEGIQIISAQTAQHVLSVMATCGLYNESGAHLVRTGMPAKSGVSGLIVASALNQNAGIAVYCPRVNHKGTSIRGELLLQELANKLGLHFACKTSPRKLI